MKKKKGGGKGKSPTANLSNEAMGLTHLHALQFKQALERFKLALKEDPRSERLKELLVEAYVGRARELAGKGMAREAAIMLEKSSSLTGRPADPMMLFSLFLNGGDMERAVSSLVGLTEKPEMRALFCSGPFAEGLAVLSLVGPGRGVAVLMEPVVSSFVDHRDTALEFLDAWDRGLDDQAIALLKKLPIGSPFKSFRVFMHALILCRAQPGTALEWLGRIHERELFHPLAQGIREILSERGGTLKSMISWSPPVRELAFRLLEVKPDAVRILGRLQSLAEKPDQCAKALLDPSLEAYFPATSLRNLCHSLLPCDPDLARPFQQRFGSLPPWENHRIRALAWERRGQWQEARHEWVRAIEFIDDPLMKAQIYRHLVEILEEEVPRQVSWGFKGYRKETESFKVQYLEASLKHDPDDRETHLALIRLHGQERNAKEVRAAVDRAIALFPEDREILEAAMDAAFAAKTFKKAVSFAQKILSFNSIHVRARDVLIEAHLSHARKKVFEKRFDLAEKELLLAESIEREHSRSGRVQACQAILAMFRGEERLAGELLRSLRNQKGFSLPRELMIQVEAHRLKAPQEMVRKMGHSLRQRIEDTVPEKGGLLQSIQDLEQYQREKIPLVKQWLQALSPWLVRAAEVNLALEERRLVCNFLLENQLFEPLESFARVGLNQWEQDPSFLFFHIFSQAKGDYRHVANKNRTVLDEIVRKVKESHLDTRTMKNIHEFISPLPLFTHSSSPFADEFDEDDEAVSDDDQDQIDSVLSMFELVIRQKIEEDAAGRRKLGDKKYAAKLARDIARSVGAGPEFIKDVREMIEDILLSRE
ncbi:MAG: hypothetical protein HQL76_14530 [Magnetococcales bacterium]|nr:hypothetical protein [Magnetococcales bacterium]